MSKIIKFEEIETWDKAFEKAFNKDSYKDYEVVDVIEIEEIEELKQFVDNDIVWAIDSVFDVVDLGYYPTYCAFTEDRVITIYYDKECPEDEIEEDKYDRELFLETLIEELKENN